MSPDLPPTDLQILLQESAIAARRLVRQLRLPQADVDDVRQDILLDLLSRLNAFDPQRGTLDAFAGVVARHRATRIANRVRRERGVFGFSHASLDDPRLSALSEVVSNDGGLAGVFGAVDETHQRIDLVRDVRNAKFRLPRSLRHLCTSLQSDTPSIAQQASGLSRATFYRRLREIRLSFLVDGLEASA